uniref:Putative capsid protein n=1 Tax=ssDNA virus sp. TaxID=2593122 RepID=A0A894JV53_9VIRU|nr:putative capsid protein [ssDNA virus sp.]
MAYGRYRRRRSYRRRRRSLSNRNVFVKTSAKAQARQIAALRNRINSVYRRTKPEIKNVVGSSISTTFSSDVITKIWLTGILPRPTPNSGSDHGIIGNYCKVLSLQLNGSFEYYNTSQTGYHNSESSGCQMRIIILQRKTPEDIATSYDLGDFIPNASNTGAEYSTMAVKPLQTGITEKWDVLYDKRYVLTSDNNQKMFRIKVRPKPYRFNAENNDIFNYVRFVVVSSGLHYDSNFTEYVEMCQMSKLSYTDA